jgi:sugar/nucleoside kinase (ribokinase family)
VSFAARVASAFGLQVGVLTSAASEEPLLAELEPYAQIVSLPAADTSTFENIYDPTGRRKQYIRGVAAPIGAGDIPVAWLSAPLVHLAPLTDEVDPQIAHRFPDATVLVTLQGWLRRWDDDGLVRFKRWYDAEVLKSVNILVFSEEDIVEGQDLEEAFARTVEHLIVTRAERGGTHYHRGRASSYDTPQVEVVNPTGAGDIYAAALLASLHASPDDMETAIRVAARLGALSVTRVGMDSAPTTDEVRQALESQ